MDKDLGDITNLESVYLGAAGDISSHVRGHVSQASRSLRRQACMKQSDVASAIGMSQAGLSSVESDGGISIATACALADFFGVGLCELVGHPHTLLDATAELLDMAGQEPEGDVAVVARASVALTQAYLDEGMLDAAQASEVLHTIAHTGWADTHVLDDASGDRADQARGALSRMALMGRQARKAAAEGLVRSIPTTPPDTGRC